MYDCDLDVVMYPCCIIFQNFSLNIFSFLYSGSKRKSQPHSQSETACFIEDVDLIVFPWKTHQIHTPMFQTALLLETGTATFTTVSYTPWLSKHDTVLVQCSPAASDYLCIPEASAKWGSIIPLKRLSFALLQQLYLSLRKKEGPTWLTECSMKVWS